MSYIVGYGLGPYFTQETVKKLVNGNSYFTLQFDETVSAQVKKQMDLLVTYWPETSNEVKVKYLTSLMFGSATATIVVKEMMYVFKKLGVPIHLMVSLGMDDPNVNKSIRDKLNNIKQEKGLPKLVMCPPSCLIHVCHNSFKKGLEQFGFNAEDLCLNLYYFFKKSPCRKSELYDIEESLGLDDLVVLRHVQSQWLSLVQALQQFLAVKEALQKLLLVEMPKNDKNIMRNAKYMAIKKSLESNDVAIEVEFLISIKPIFDNFLTKFQAEEPMIHLLYSNCEKLLKVAMGRLMKNEVYMDRNGKDLQNVDVDDVGMQLQQEAYMNMQGQSVCDLLYALPEAKQKQPIVSMKCFYKAIIKYLQKMLPMDDVLLDALGCLNTQEKKSAEGLEHCMTIPKKLSSITGEEQVKVGDEWLRYQEMDVTNEDLEVRVDHFWNKIFSKTDESGDKFIILPKMVKCALVLCHSNADVERSLC